MGTEDQTTAQQALAKADSVERALAAVMQVMGWSYQPLPLHPEPMAELYQTAKQLMETLKTPGEPPILPISEIRPWAECCLKMTPGYLSLLVEVTKDPNSWAVYLDLLEELVHLPLPMEEPELLIGQLDAARKNLQQAAYLLCVRKGLSTEWAVDRVDDRIDTRIFEMLVYLKERGDKPVRKKGIRG